MKRSRRFGSRLAVLLSSLGLMLLAAAQPAAASSTKFGADVVANVQPTNGSPAHTCDHELTGHFPGATYKCTWIEAAAYGYNDEVAHAQAEKDGTIVKIKLISCVKGSFTLYIAHFDQTTHKGKVVTQGPVINYVADCPGPTTFNVQKFSVDIQVHKGDYLATQSAKAGFVRCTSGGEHTALYRPPLAVGNPATSQAGSSGCYLLLEAVYG